MKYVIAFNTTVVVQKYCIFLQKIEKRMSGCRGLIAYYLDQTALNILCNQKPYACKKYYAYLAVPEKNQGKIYKIWKT